jgi:hypothetical protein
MKGKKSKNKQSGIYKYIIGGKVPVEMGLASFTIGSENSNGIDIIKKLTRRYFALPLVLLIQCRNI